MKECIFCQIIHKKLPSTIVDENEHVIVIKDIHPKAPIHYLVMPKLHIAHFAELQETPEHTQAMIELIAMIRKLATNLPDPKAFTLISNNGSQAGQSVLHMHWHFLAGKNIYSSGFTL